LKLLDLCCGAGLGADGYAAVGFEIYGIDNRPQSAYPYRFRQGDVLDVLRSNLPERFEAIHVSPPCQLFTIAGNLRTAQGGTSKETVDLLTPTIELLRERWSHKVWVVENVEQARSLMPGAVTLCGSAFYLEVKRHRLFLSNVPLRGTTCHHDRFPLDPASGKPRPWGVYHVPKDSIPSGGRTARDAEHGRHVMGSRRLLKWDELKEGFPPAYASHVGADLLVSLR
jgi:DNA (cytosine-5)-methyltransferase 1